MRCKKSAANQFRLAAVFRLRLLIWGTGYKASGSIAVNIQGCRRRGADLYIGLGPGTVESCIDELVHALCNISEEIARGGHTVGAGRAVTIGKAAVKVFR